jgi:hypothetical protein
MKLVGDLSCALSLTTASYLWVAEFGSEPYGCGDAGSGGIYGHSAVCHRDFRADWQIPAAAGIAVRASRVPPSRPDPTSSTFASV